MIIPDVNVLVYACNVHNPKHEAATRALADGLDSAGGLALTSICISGLIRINLQTRFADNPPGVSVVLDFADGLVRATNSHWVEAGPDHWNIFRELVRSGRFQHRMTTDAWFAALAMEKEATLISFDGGFAQFEGEGLTWRHLTA